MKSARRLSVAALAVAGLAPLVVLSPAVMGPAARPAGDPGATVPAVRPAVDAVGEDDEDQSCDQEGGYAVTDRPTALSEYGASRVWAHATGAGVRVAVVDSGLNVANPHFTNDGPRGDSYAPGVSLLPASLGRRFANTYHPRGWADPSGHGTAVAGIIAARQVEGSPSRVIGLAPEATIVPVQVFGAVAEDADVQAPGLLPDTGRLAAGIRWAANANVDVIAVSMSVLKPDQRLADAVAHAVERDILVVASAGSALTAADGDPGGVHYPAGFPGVLGVAALDTDGQPTELGFEGEHVDVAAPGQQVATAYRGLLDCYLGTEPAPSYAVPYVAATAALLAEKYPDEGPELWAHRIMMSAQRPAQGVRDDAIGWGAVSPYDALTMTVDPHRPGPPVPGHEPVQVETHAAVPGAVSPPDDPWADGRTAGLLLAGGGVGLVTALALARALLHRGRVTRGPDSGGPD